MRQELSTGISCLLGLELLILSDPVVKVLDRGNSKRESYSEQ